MWIDLGEVLYLLGLLIVSSLVLVPIAIGVYAAIDAHYKELEEK
jgi:hypothetical protein